ncbi:MAG: chemotaxis protein [Clostridiales bacterium]|jgi:two-component system chemotaxis response regulator CheV|nr:chemotaxis protein [Clostridiales bacterium]
MAKQNSSDILLEAGTNELMIMEFSIDGRSYGINVAKVSEIMQYQPVTPVPNSSKFVEGVFKPRDNIITVIDLPLYLGLSPSRPGNKDIMIITNFNNVNNAFHVHNVEMIHRISWTAMEKPDETIYNNVDNVTIGIARIGEKLINILDFEKIMAEIGPGTGLDPKSFKKTEVIHNNAIYIAEDSLFLMKLIEECLHNAGYVNLITFSNGMDCLNALLKVKDEHKDSLSDHAAILITDIEMPMMDGHALTKAVKTDPVLHQIPVIIFSSLINESMMQKGRSVGADDQISKPEIHRLVEIIGEYTKK